MSAASELSPDGFAELKAYLITHTGLAYYSDKDAELQAKLRAQIGTRPFASFGDYLSFLRQGSQAEPEMQELLQKLLIGETYFFRYREQFKALQEQILPDLIKQRHGADRLRIWSAGCASGEETYSLALLLAQAFPELKDWNIDILGTDLNPEFIKLARRATYREWSFRQSSLGFQQRYFEQQGIRWQLRPAYRRGVRFAVHNLVQEPFEQLGPKGLDLILCRNVLIYFAPETQKRLIQAFYEHLQPQGWLVLGPSELSPLSCQPFAPMPLARLSCYRKHIEGVPQTQTSPLRSAPPITLSEPPPSRPASVLAMPPPDHVPDQTPDHAPARDSELEQIRQLADQGLLTEAFERVSARLAHDGLNPILHYYAGLILAAQGQDHAAQQALQRSLYLDRNQVLAHYQLALILQKRGQHQEARKRWRNVEQLLAVRHDDDWVLPTQELSVRQLKEMMRTHQKGKA